MNSFEIHTIIKDKWRNQSKFIPLRYKNITNISLCKYCNIHSVKSKHRPVRLNDEYGYIALYPSSFPYFPIRFFRITSFRIIGKLTLISVRCRLMSFKWCLNSHYQFLDDSFLHIVEHRSILFFIYFLLFKIDT